MQVRVTLILPHCVKIDMNTVHSLSFICMVLYFGYVLVFCTNCHYTFVRVGTLYMVETLLLLGRFS